MLGSDKGSTCPTGSCVECLAPAGGATLEVSGNFEKWALAGANRSLGMSPCGGILTVIIYSCHIFPVYLEERSCCHIFLLS